jgi:hypothetical protein
VSFDDLPVATQEAFGDSVKLKAAAERFDAKYDDF